MKKEYVRLTKVLADFEVELKKTENEARVIADKKKSQKSDLDALVSLYEERGDLIVGRNAHYVFLDANIDPEITEDKDKILHRFRSKSQTNELFREENERALGMQNTFEDAWNKRENLKKQQEAEDEYRDVLNDLKLDVKGSIFEKEVLSEVTE